MADQQEEEGHDRGNERREGEGSEEVLPLETPRTTAEQHLPQTRSTLRSQEFGQPDPPPRRLPFHTSSMMAYSRDAQRVNSQQNIPQRQQLTGVTGRDFSSVMHQYPQPQLLAFPPSQGAVSSHYFRQPFQHGQQMGGFLVDSPGATIAYGNPHSFGTPYPHSLPRFQPQPPIPGNQMDGPYYPMPQHHSRQIYLNAPGTIARPEQHYIAPLQSSGAAVLRRPASVGRAGPGLLQTNPASLSRQSSGSSATSSPLRGPPRKPKQSGYALWCGNLPAQTNIIELKDHFSRGATNDIESVFLISKSNCAFINYKTEQSCKEALARFHDSRFRGAKLVCRLRRSSAAIPPGTPTGPRSNLLSGVPSQAARAVDNPPRTIGEDEDEEDGEAVQKVEEKFFVLKSLTVEDLDASVQSGSWATQSHNEAALNAAYQSANNVYLVFSANKSGEYYGYARMASGIDNTVDIGESPLPRPSSSTTPAADQSVIPTSATEHAPKGRIIDDSARGTIFWEAQADEHIETQDPQVEASSSVPTEGDIGQQSLGHPFRIEWVSIQRLHFHQARGLRNPWNQNRVVKIARDGTEIEPSVGRRLVDLFHNTQASNPSSGGPQIPYPLGNLRLAPTGYPVDARFAQNH